MIIRITSEEDDKYVEGRIPDEAGYEEVVYLVDGLFIAHGFHYNTVKEARPEED